MPITNYATIWDFIDLRQTPRQQALSPGEQEGFVVPQLKFRILILYSKVKHTVIVDFYAKGVNMLNVNI